MLSIVVNDGCPDMNEAMSVQNVVDLAVIEPCSAFAQRHFNADEARSKVIDFLGQLSTVFCPVVRLLDFQVLLCSQCMLESSRLVSSASC